MDETNKDPVGHELDASSSNDVEGEPELLNNVSTSQFIAQTIEKLQSQSRLGRESKLGSKMSLIDAKSEKKTRRGRNLSSTIANTANLNVK